MQCVGCFLFCSAGVWRCLKDKYGYSSTLFYFINSAFGTDVETKPTNNMKKTFLLCFVTITLLLSSCAKEESQEPCEINNTGTLTIKNMTSSTLTVTIDGSNFSVSTGNDVTKTVSAGVHNYSATGGGHSWSGTKDVIQCGETTVNLII